MPCTIPIASLTLFPYSLLYPVTQDRNTSETVFRCDKKPECVMDTVEVSLLTEGDNRDR